MTKRKRVAVTRAAHQATSFVTQLEAAGFEAVMLPVIAIEWQEFTIPRPLAAYEWIVFTSANGVHGFFQQQHTLTRYTKIAAVGEKTAQAIREQGWPVHFIPTVYDADTLVQEFPARKSQRPFLLVSGQLARPTLAEGLRAKGIDYERVITYTTKQNTALHQEWMYPDYLTFTSPSTVAAFIDLFGSRPGIYQLPVVSIGATTTKAIQLAGFQYVYEATTYTIEGLVQQLIERRDHS